MINVPFHRPVGWEGAPRVARRNSRRLFMPCTSRRIWACRSRTTSASINITLHRRLVAGRTGNMLN